MNLVDSELHGNNKVLPVGQANKYLARQSAIVL